MNDNTIGPPVSVPQSPTCIWRSFARLEYDLDSAASVLESLVISAGQAQVKVYPTRLNTKYLMQRLQLLFWSVHSCFKFAHKSKSSRRTGVARSDLQSLPLAGRSNPLPLRHLLLALTV